MDSTTPTVENATRLNLKLKCEELIEDLKRVQQKLLDLQRELQDDDLHYRSIISGSEFQFMSDRLNWEAENLGRRVSDALDTSPTPSSNPATVGPSSTSPSSNKTSLAPKPKRSYTIKEATIGPIAVAFSILDNVVMKRTGEVKAAAEEPKEVNAAAEKPVEVKVAVVEPNEAAMIVENILSTNYLKENGSEPDLQASSNTSEADDSGNQEEEVWRYQRSLSTQSSSEKLQEVSNRSSGKFQDATRNAEKLQDVSTHSSEKLQDVSTHSLEKLQYVSTHSSGKLQDVSTHSAGKLQDVSKRSSRLQGVSLHSSETIQNLSTHSAGKVQNVSIRNTEKIQDVSPRSSEILQDASTRSPPKLHDAPPRSRRKLQDASTRNTRKLQDASTRSPRKLQEASTRSPRKLQDVSTRNAGKPQDVSILQDVSTHIAGKLQDVEALVSASHGRNHSSDEETESTDYGPITSSSIPPSISQYVKNHRAMENLMIKLKQLDRNLEAMENRKSFPPRTMELPTAVDEKVKVQVVSQSTQVERKLHDDEPIPQRKQKDVGTLTRKQRADEKALLLHHISKKKGERPFKESKKDVLEKTKEVPKIKFKHNPNEDAIYWKEKATKVLKALVDTDVQDMEFLSTELQRLPSPTHRDLTLPCQDEHGYWATQANRMFKSLLKQKRCNPDIWSALTPYADLEDALGHLIKDRKP